MKKAYEWFCKIEEFACCVGFVLMIALVFLSAIMRTAGKPLAWSIDVAQLLLCWTTLIGADVAYRHGKFLGLDLITRHFPLKVRRVIELFIDVCILVTLMILFVFGMDLSISSWLRQFQTLTISYSWVTIALPVTCLFMSITVMIETVKRIKNFNKPEEEKGQEAA